MRGGTPARQRPYCVQNLISDGTKETGMKARRIVFCLCAALLFCGVLATAGALDKNAKGELTNWTRSARPVL
jgi:hypothetical protein